MIRSSTALRQIWAWPITLGVLSLLGLLLALFDDEGPLDVFSWFALGSLIVVCLWFGLLARRNGAKKDTR